MADFLPSRKFILIFTLLIVAGGGFWIYKNKPWHDSGLVYDPQAAVKAAQTSRTADANLDTDGDGLKDWQEVLFKLDPVNPDTDNDGVLDGNESPGEAGSIAVADNQANPGSSAENLSQKFAEDVMMGYMALTSSGMDDNAIFEILLEGLGKKYSDAAPLQDSFGENDVKLAGNSPEEIRAYANGVAEVLENDFKDFSKNEMELFNELAESDYSDPEALLIFGDYETAYSVAASHLKSLKTPGSYVSFHADLVNNFQNLAIINSAFKNLASDPLNAIFYLSSYKKESERFQNAMAGTANKLLKDNISFLPDDGGKTLLSYSSE